MPQLLKLSVAARLAEVSRGEIQDKIRSGEFETFEGKVAITDLMRVYPQVNLDHDPMLEQVERTKANARPKKFAWEQDGPGELPSPEVMARDIHNLAEQLGRSKQELAQYSSLVDDISARLSALSDTRGSEQDLRREIAELSDWITAAAQSARADDGKPDERQFMHLIAADVELIPSGHHFLVDGGDTILQAAVRAGLNIGYGCNDGSCGQCKARVIEGRVLETCKPKYQLSPHEKQMDYALMCCNTAVTDVTLEAAEVLKPGDLPRQDMPAVISRLSGLEGGMLMAWVKVPKDQNFRFFAGQNVEFLLPGGQVARVPIVSCPCDGSELQIVVDQGELPDYATALESAVGVEGGRLYGPIGEFILREMADRPSLFIANGAGFSPIRSLLEHGVAQGRIEQFHVYRFAEPGTPLYLENCCRAWADSIENFTYQRFDLNGDFAQVLTKMADGFPSLDGFDAALRDTMFKQ